MASARESSMLLMGVIESLSTGGAARESAKEHLMKTYNSADQSINDLVEEHHDALTQSIRSYAKIAGHLTASQQRVTFLKESLGKCKQLLHCKRDYLLKLWVETREQREVLKILDRIDEVKSAPEQLARHLANKHYLLATRLVTSNIKLLEGELESIEALRELRAEMRRQKETLHFTLIDELHRHLYVVASGKSRRPDLGTSSKDRTENLVDKVGLVPEEDSSHFMKIIVESLATLMKLPDAVDRIICRMDSEFTKMLQMLIEKIASQCEVQGDTVFFTDETEKPEHRKLFTKLLRIAFERFTAVARAHSVLLDHLKEAMFRHSVDVPLYSSNEVWSAAQFALQGLLAEYYDVKNFQGSRDASNFHSVSNLTNYFDIKKKQRRRSKPLFNFDSSTIALTVQSVQATGAVSGMPDETLATNESTAMYKFLCRPHPENVTVSFNDLTSIASSMKTMLKIPQKQHCTLSEFVEEFVATTYMNRVHSETREKMTAATEGMDAFKIVRNDEGNSKKAGPDRPIFQGTITVTQFFSRIRTLQMQLPVFLPQLLDVKMGVLDMYRKSMMDLFWEQSKPRGDDTVVLSASWTSSTQVASTFISFHSWNTFPQLQSDAEAVAPAGVLSKVFSLSPHHRETEFIKAFLAEDVLEGDCKVHGRNVLSLSGSTFSMVACLQESLEWTYRCYEEEESYHMVPDFCDPQEQSRYNVLKELKTQIRDLSHRVLVVLHVELRFQCVHHLNDILQRVDYACNENDSLDGRIVELNKYLTGVEETLSQHLQPFKVRYLLSGIGHFLASLVLDACENIQSLNRHGIRKLCRMVFSIQQNLTNLTMAREVELDKARQYCELFHLRADELAQVILDQGRVFSDDQYRTALRLMILQGQFKTGLTFADYWGNVRTALTSKRVAQKS